MFKIPLQVGQGWSHRRWFWTVSLVLVLLYILIIAVKQMALIDGRLAFWLQDDMMISMRYGQNLVRGFGLVWNPGGARVEGYSNLMWVLLMAAVHLLRLPSTLNSLLILVLNIIIAVVVLWQTARLWQRLDSPKSIALPFALLSIAISVDLARWSTIGLETPLLTALFLWLVIRVMDEASKGKPQASTFLAAGLLGLIRVDGFVLGAVLCLLALLLHRDKWRVILYSPLILVLPAAHIVFRMDYYGYPMPNTYYLKITAWRSRWLFGVQHVAKFLPFIALLWIVATVGVVASHDRRARALWLLGLPLLVYTIYVGGDDFSRLRFLSPWMPILYVLAFLTPHWLGWEYRHPRVSSLLLILLFLLMAATNGYLPFSSATSTEEPWVRTGLLIRNITEPDTSIGVFPAGTLPYFAERPSVDMLGKNDYVVARRAAFPGANRPGHNKFDYEYSLNQHQPDLLMVLFPPSQIIEPGALDRLASGDLAFGGQLYLNDTFQADYASNLAFIDTIPFFIRKDSGLQDQLMSEPCEPVTREALLRLNFQTVCWPEFEHNLRE